MSQCVDRLGDSRMSRVNELSASENGFTLIELMIVVAIIANLLAIAVPSYIQLKDRASQRAASSDVRAAIPSAEKYADDHSASYTGMDVKVGGVYTALKAYDAGLDVTTVKVAVGGASKKEEQRPAGCPCQMCTPSLSCWRSSCSGAACSRSTSEARTRRHVTST